MSSIFTKIINHEIPSTIEYQDAEFIVIRDINPHAPIHVLVIPKKEYRTLEEVDIADEHFHSKILLVARTVAKQLGISENYKLIMNVGNQMQVVPHIHLHLMGGWDNVAMEKERNE